MPNPNPESHEPRCSIWITHIKFNFDLTSHSNDALNIRADGLHDIPVPEWDQSKFLPQQSPAAYAIKETAGQTVYIQCRFAMDLASAAATAHVKATGGGILGTIDSVTVNFVNGNILLSPGKISPGNGSTSARTAARGIQWISQRITAYTSCLRSRLHRGLKQTRSGIPGPRRSITRSSTPTPVD